MSTSSAVIAFGENGAYNYPCLLLEHYIQVLSYWCYQEVEDTNSQNWRISLLLFGRSVCSLTINEDSETEHREQHIFMSRRPFRSGLR